MSDYKELISDLRDAEQANWKRLSLDAAAAIEGLVESVHIRDKHLDELNHYIWKLEAEVKQLKECNDELREAQTYIDHYGDKWMTSAKDVPTSAYEHGYADGRNEAEAQLPKRGEWLHGREIGKEWMYDHWVTYYEDWHCSNCNVVFKQEEKPKYNYCPNCGADMRAKTEVQE